MANTLKFGNGEWYGKKDTILAYNDENNNYKPLPFDFSRASSATVINKDGLIETVGSGEPRIDYTDDSKGALLLEPTRSNNITYSDLQSQGVWYPSPSWTVSDNSQISPKGILDASSLTENLTNGYHSGYYQPAINNGYTGSYTISCFAKYNGRNIALSPKSATERTIFDLQNGSINQLGGGGVTAKIENYGSGWYRCSVTCSFSNENVRFEHLLANNNSLQYQGDGVSGIYIYGCQAEQGSYATSYIPTQGSSVTRVADSCNQTPPSDVIGQTEGTILVDVDFKTLSGTNMFVSIRPDASNKIEIYRSDAVIYAEFASNASFNFNKPSVTVGRYKIAVAYSSGSSAMYINGVFIGSNTTTFAFTSTLDDIYINSRGTSFIEQSNYNDFKLYNTRLSNAELQALTSN